MGLDYKGCLVGIGFDGASAMNGKLGGVQKLIKDKAQMAYYFHFMHIDYILYKLIQSRLYQKVKISFSS